MASLATQNWLNSPTAIRGVFVEVGYWDVGTSSEKKTYFSNKGYSTTDGTIIFDPSIVGGVTFSESISADYSISMSFGDIQLSNVNGLLDYLLNGSLYVFVNRPITVYVGDPQWVCANLAEIKSKFEPVFTGLIADIDSKSRTSIDIKVRDNLEKLNSPITEAKISDLGEAWSDTLSNGDNIKPLIFGEVFNISPQLYNSAYLDYIVNDGNTESIIEIRDNGAPLYTYNGTTVTLNDVTSTVTASYASKVDNITVTETSALNNSLLCAGTANLVPSTPIVFTGTTFGNVLAATTYYVKAILDNTHFTISTTAGGTTFIVSSATGSLSGVNTAENIFACNSTLNMVTGTPIKFSGTLFGNVLPDTTYYIKQVYEINKYISISDESGGTVRALTTSSGTMNLIVSTVDTNLENGTFRLNLSPTGTVTASVQGVKNSINLSNGALISGTYNNNIANLIALITTQYGKESTRLTVSELDLPNLDAFADANTQSVGIMVANTTNVLTVCQGLAKSVGAQLRMTRNGKLQLIKFGVPSAVSSSIDDTDILQHSLSISSKLDVQSSIKLGYCKAWTIQSGLLTSIPYQHKELFATEWYPKIYTDDGTKLLYKQNEDPTQVDSYLIVEAEALAEATRLVNFFKTPRYIYKFTGFSTLLNLQLGQQVTLTHNRFNLNNGISGQVISLSPNWLTSTIEVGVLSL